MKYCNHDWEVKSEHVDRWTDASDIYTALVVCKKCGKAKYISNSNPFKYWVLLASFLVIIMVGLIIINS